MEDNSVDPWHQEVNIFSSPKITGIPSLDTVQNTLKNQIAGTESRVSVSPLDEELLGVFVAKPLNPALGGGSYSLFQPQPHSTAGATVFIELPQVEPQGTPNREIDPSVSQGARIGEAAEKLNSKKRNNQCLNPSRRDFNINYGV